MHPPGVFAGQGRPRRDNRDLCLSRFRVRRHQRGGASGAGQGAGRNLRNAPGGGQPGSRGLMAETFVIVGAGLAGGGAAATLREEGFDGRVLLIGAESQPPYERPPLSKEYLRGESPFEQALFQPPDFYGENDIETRFGVRVTRVDVAGKEIELDNAQSVPTGTRRWWWGWALSGLRWRHRSGSRAWRWRSWIGTRCRCAGSSARRSAGWSRGSTATTGRS